jgi:TolB protein
MPAVVAALVVLLVPIAIAEATAPGTNGQIAFRRYLGPDRTKGAIFIAAPDGSGERQLTTPPAGSSDDFPDVAPDGSFVAFQRCATTCGIFIVKTDGSGLRRVDDGCPRLPPRCTDNSYPAISPDGRQIAFDRAFGRIRGDTIDHSGTIHPDGTGLRQATHAGPATKVYSASFSPDGTAITLGMTGVDKQADVYTMHTDGTGLAPVTRTPQWDSAPDWGPPVP